jgi:phage terminase large subunit-like protein
MLENQVAVPRIHAATHNGKENGNPVLLSAETLRVKRQNQGAYVFASQQLLNPIADAAMGFDRRWLVMADTSYEAAMRALFRVIIVDPAGGKQRKNNDYTTMLVLGYGADKKYRLLDMKRDRMSLTMRGDTLMELHRQWKPEVVAYEEYGMQADIEFVKHLQERDLYEFDITPLGGGMRKELRMLRLVPYFENGFLPTEQGGDGVAKSRIILPTKCIIIDYQGHARDLVKDFIEQEYTAFPVLKHDDMLDCLARIVDLEAAGLIKEPTVTPTKPRSETGFSQTSKGDAAWYMA